MRRWDLNPATSATREWSPQLEKLMVCLICDREDCKHVPRNAPEDEEKDADGKTFPRVRLAAPSDRKERHKHTGLGRLFASVEKR